MLFLGIEGEAAAAVVMLFNHPLHAAEVPLPTGRQLACRAPCGLGTELALQVGSMSEKLVVQGKAKPVRAWVALASRSTDQLAVDPSGSVHFRGNDVKPPARLTTSSKTISVPRPAMFVAIVTRPRVPA